ncbi:uncharacterized protein LOC131845394 [Achroia grisella]|uniref:uncharacterized protein LOC131845394 n=1 Tax=Achroia grisella TaxID=688607 RepID=UPI0027D258C1|nr:uncharacterized protein LOC131845394 [Achroia grisella]
MAPYELHGYTLGERHKNYNAHFRKLIDGNCGLPLEKINNDDTDINNFLKIDLACHNRNVNYVLDIYKYEDTLYVSRAIKRSTWLIKDNQYENIINPDYLHTQLFPHMTSKAKCKLLLSIRLNLRGESRVETFFNYIKKDSINNALKWLPHCSAPFIEKVVEEHRDAINIPLLTRLCKKNCRVLEIRMSKTNWQVNPEMLLRATKFLIHTHPEIYMKSVLSTTSYYIPRFGARATKSAMKLCPDKILGSFDIICQYIHLPTFVKNYKHEDLKDFLLSITEHKNLKYWINSSIPIFKKYMPKEHRVQIVQALTDTPPKRAIIENTTGCDIDELLSKCAVASNTNLPGSVTSFGDDWYNLLPFEIAFPKIIPIIRTESLGRYRNKLLKILLCTAGNNSEHIHSVLQFYRNKHINEPFICKIEFINNVLSQTYTHRFDKKTWNILNELFCSIELYDDDAEKTLQNCVNCVLIYNVLHGIKVPEAIEKKIKTDSFKYYRSKLNQLEKDKIFNYLYNHLLSKLQSQKVTNEVNLTTAVKILESLFKLLDDWGKQLCNYTILLEKFKEFVKINKANSWNYDLSNLYVINKSCRRYMFEESLILCPSDNLCMYALKHDPDFLKQHREEIMALIFEDNSNKLNHLKHTLEKLRTYWPLSMAPEWADEYQRRLDTPSAHKGVKGLCVLLSSDNLVDIFKRYAPIECKIDINETIAPIVSLHKQIAMNMYVARPLISLNTVLWYSAGDYFKYARSSLDAIMYNTSPIKNKKYISILLQNNRISVQKYIVKFAGDQLTSEAIPLIYNMWKSTNNISLRNIIFTKVYSILMKTKHIEVWEVLSNFIDDLLKSNTGSSTISNILQNANKVPTDIRVCFYVKSFIYLSSLPFDPMCTRALESLKSQINQIVSLHLLCAKNEKSQMESFEKVLIPYIEKCNINDFTNCMIGGIHKYIGNIKTVPVKLFEAIQIKLNNTLPTDKNYIVLTKWNLTTAFLKSLASYAKSAELDDTPEKRVSALLIDTVDAFETNAKWKKICVIMTPLFKDICVQYLEQEVQIHSPSIYTVFSTALTDTIETLQFEDRQSLIKSLLADYNRIMYLVVLNMLPKDYDETKENAEIREILLSQSPPEVKMYYFEKFNQPV